MRLRIPSLIITFIMVLPVLFVFVVVPSSVSADVTYLVTEHWDNTSYDWENWTTSGLGCVFSTSTTYYIDGTKSGQMQASASSGGSFYRSVTTGGSDIDFEFWYRNTNNPTGYLATSNSAGANNHGIVIKVNTGGSFIQLYNGTTEGYVNTAVVGNHNTWYRFNGTLFATGGYQYYSLYINNVSRYVYWHGDDDGVGIDRFACQGVGSSTSTYHWMDKVMFFVGVPDVDSFHIVSFPALFGQYNCPYYNHIRTNVSDSEVDFTYVSGPSWLSLASTGYLNGTVPSSAIGQSYSISVSVNDSYEIEYQNYTLKCFDDDSKFSSLGVFVPQPSATSSSTGGINVGDYTYIAYQGQGDADQTATYIQRYNHITGGWTEPVKVCDNDHDDNTPNSPHSNPTMVLDDAGYLHIFSGCHFTPIKQYRSTTAIDADGLLVLDEVAFSYIQDIGEHCTYPSAYLNSDDSNIYLIYRDSDPGTNHPWSIKVSGNNGMTWGVLKNDFLAFGDGHAPYLRYCSEYDGHPEYLWFALYDYDYGTDPYGEYKDLGAFWMNLDTGNIYAPDDTYLGVSLDYTDYLDHCKIIDTPSDANVMGCDIWYDPVNNRPCIAYMNNTDDDGDSARFLYYSGGVWSEELISNITGWSTQPTIVGYDNGTVAVYYSSTDDKTYTSTTVDCTMFLSIRTGPDAWTCYGAVINDGWTQSEYGYFDHCQRVTDRYQKNVAEYEVVFGEYIYPGSFVYTEFGSMYLFNTSDGGTFIPWYGIYEDQDWTHKDITAVVEAIVWMLITLLPALLLAVCYQRLGFIVGLLVMTTVLLFYDSGFLFVAVISYLGLVGIFIRGGD